MHLSLSLPLSFPFTFSVCFRGRIPGLCVEDALFVFVVS